MSTSVGKTKSFCLTYLAATLFCVFSAQASTQKEDAQSKAPEPKVLGTLGGKNSYVKSISPDGKVVIGNSDTAAGQPHAFMWQEDSGIKEIGAEKADFVAIAVSKDGSVVVGTDANNQLLIWDKNEAKVSTILLPNFQKITKESLLISGNGKIVMGTLETPKRLGRFFWWSKETGLQFPYSDSTNVHQDISYIPGAISFDGNIAYGYISGGNIRPFRWTKPNYEDCQGTEAGCIQEFKNIGDDWLLIKAISRDGSIAVGSYGKKSHAFAFRLTKEKGMEDLGYPFEATAIDAEVISQDGQTIAGSASVSADGTTSNFREHLIRWTEEQGSEDLGAFEGRFKPSDISDDGKVIVGVDETFSKNEAKVHLVQWTEKACEENPSHPGCIKDLGLIGTQPTEEKPRISGSAKTIAAQKVVEDGAVQAAIWPVVTDEDTPVIPEEPVAVAGQDFTLKSNTEYSVVHVLDASASKNAVSYHWRVLDGKGQFWLQEAQGKPWQTELTGKTVRALAPKGSQGVARYELTVTDAKGRTHTDTVEMKVYPTVPTKPIAVAGEDFSLSSDKNNTVVHVLDASASKNAVSYHWRVLKGKGQFWLQEAQGKPWQSELTGKTVRALAPKGSQGEAVYELTVTDMQGQKNVSTVKMTVSGS